MKVFLLYLVAFAIYTFALWHVYKWMNENFSRTRLGIFILFALGDLALIYGYVFTELIHV